MTGAVGDCRYCHRITYVADELGPAHPCCAWWDEHDSTGARCPACGESRAAERKRQERLASRGKRRN